MEKNSFKLIFSICLFVIYLHLSVSSSFAAVLHWSPVASTDDCVIEGYKVHYGAISGQYSVVIDVRNVTSCDLDLLDLVPTQTYFFAVNAYSTTDQEGPLSAPVSYRDSPNIDASYSIDYANATIDIAYNESNMLGADIKGNYEFSPTLLFAEAGIALIDRTYRLFMNYIPEYTIITMTVSNVTDSSGNALISNSIVLNDDDHNGLADDWEFINHDTGGSNSGPGKPVLNLPGNLSANVDLAPRFVTNPYVDPENDAHARTQWQISTEPAATFTENILYNLETSDFLTSLVVPEFILDPNTTYYWRVRFFDIFNGASLWSDVFSFTTLSINPEDPNGNGVPDTQQVMDVTIDLNNNGYSDSLSSTYKMVTNGSLSLGLEASYNVTGVEFLKLIDPDDIDDTFGKPAGLSFGLIQFKIGVANPGDTAQVRIYFSEPVGKKWYKYDLKNGWSEYTDEVSFSSDRKSVLLTLVDGGDMDSDGVANGIIVDPSGPGSVVTVSSAPGAGGGGGGGCFIATAAFGSPMEKHVQVLKDFRDVFLLKSKLGTAFVRAYYQYSPPVADIIARHGVLRSVVRIGLMPLVGFGYVVIYTSSFQQGMFFLLFVGMTAWAVICIRKYLFLGHAEDLFDGGDSV